MDGQIAFSNKKVGVAEVFGYKNDTVLISLKKCSPGWMVGQMGESKSRCQDCLQQSKINLRPKIQFYKKMFYNNKDFCAIIIQKLINQEIFAEPNWKIKSFSNI